MPELIGKKIGPIGYGLMGLTWRKTPIPEEQAFEALKASLKAGCNLWNAGEFYGTPDNNSCTLLEKYFTKYPEDAEKVVLSVKGGLQPNLHPDGSPEGVKRSVDNCLRMLNGKKSIDIFECARQDKGVPLETTLTTLKEYVKAGKIGGIGLSEISAATVQEACKITKIVACEVELSLWSTDIFSNQVAKVCADNSIPIVAYSPIGRGMLTGQIKKPEDFPVGDLRRQMPRFQPENFQTNLELVGELEKIAKEKGCTPAQLAIGWILHLSKKDGNPEIIPIPGATTQERIAENAQVAALSNSEAAEIEPILKRCIVAGDRYGGLAKAHIEG